jgi:hypothetical protein
LDNSVGESGREEAETVIRFLSIVIGAALIGYPPFLIYAITVPVARFRTDRYVDFLAFGGTVLAIYGGVFVGIAVHRVVVGRAWQRLRPLEVLKAGVRGALFSSSGPGSMAWRLKGRSRRASAIFGGSS